MSANAHTIHGTNGYYARHLGEGGTHEYSKSSGRCYGGGARALGIEGKELTAEEIGNLMRGFTPDGKALLRMNAGAKRGIAGVELTISMPKQGSIAILVLPEDKRKEFVANCHEETIVKDVLPYLESQAAFSRRGKGGTNREKVGLVVLTVTGVLNRHGEPNVHTHFVVLNVGYRPSDKSWGAIETRPLFLAQSPVNAIYNAGVTQRIEKNLEIVCEREKNSFRIKGTDKGKIDRVAENLSTPREEIKQKMEERQTSGPRAAARPRARCGNRSSTTTGAKSKTDSTS